MKDVDVIVVGAGNSGLISAISLLTSGYKVLLLDEKSTTGGGAKTIVKGRFEFEPVINNLYINNDISDIYQLRNILDKFGITEKINFSQITESFKVISKDKEYILPLNLQEFIKKVEEYIPNSITSLRLFFKLAIECNEAMNYIFANLDNIDYKYLNKEYMNFVKICGCSVSKVLDTIEMSLEVQEIINSLWICYGSPETEIAFVDYAVFIYNLLENGACIPNLRTYSISATLTNFFLENGGVLKLSSKVEEIIINDGKVEGVRLANQDEYKAKYVIVNSTLDNVCRNLINPTNIPQKALEELSRHKNGARLFTIHLGLNRSYKELNINHYMYFIYNSLDSDVAYARMNDFNTDSLIATCLNVANKKASPEGSTILSLTAYYYDDCFDLDIERDNYEYRVNSLAKDLIKKFEKSTGIKILDYIEEIEIVTPINTIIDNNSSNGSIYDYKLSGLDNNLPKILNRKNENYFDGLFICNGFEGDLYAYNSSYIKGLIAANSVKKRMVGEKNE